MMKTKKEKVFDAILETVWESGSASSITVSEIASRAGIGKGSVYMYFANKEEMMAEAIKYFVESTMNGLVIYDTGGGKSFRETMTDFIYEHLTVIKKYSKMFYSAVNAEYFPQLTPKFKKVLMDLLTDIRGKYINIIRSLAELGAKEGVISQNHTLFEILAVAQMFFSASGHFVQNEEPVVTDDMDEYVLMMYDMAVKMLN